MKRRQPDWLNYWNETDDLNYLLNVKNNISDVYAEIKSDLGRMLMSEEMLEIQESLENRIDELQKSKKIGQKIAA